MAKIGMKYLMYAKEQSYTAGSPITYATGKIFAHAISGTVTPNRRKNPLFGDDVKIENDAGITDYTLALESDRLPIADRADLLGEEAVYDSSTPPVLTHYEVVDGNPPYVGFGYMRTTIEDNTPKFETFWFHRVQFSLDNESDGTKGEQIQWKTYPFTGTGFGVQIDSSMKTKFYAHMEFTTEAAALAWLKARAGIT